MENKSDICEILIIYTQISKEDNGRLVSSEYFRNCFIINFGD